MTDRLKNQYFLTTFICCLLAVFVTKMSLLTYHKTQRQSLKWYGMCVCRYAICICSLLDLTIISCCFLHAPLFYLHSPPSQKRRVGRWQNCRDIKCRALLYWCIIFALSNSGFLQNIPNLLSRIFVLKFW